MLNLMYILLQKPQTNHEHCFLQESLQSTVGHYPVQINDKKLFAFRILFSQNRKTPYYNNQCKYSLYIITTKRRIYRMNGMIHDKN